MMAALYAARGGAETVLLERNEKLGKKLYITGKGRCNLTNAATPELFMQNIVRNPRFLYSALDALDNTKLMALVENAGTPLKIERGGRVFPVSDHASDVTRALESELRRAGVEIRLKTGAQALSVKNGRVAGVEQGDRIIERPARAVDVAAGKRRVVTGGRVGRAEHLLACVVAGILLLEGPQECLTPDLGGEEILREARGRQPGEG
jgi:predicted flavoprotein YhiN